jgi:hypothetical protein
MEKETIEVEGIELDITNKEFNFAAEFIKNLSSINKTMLIE